MKIIDNVGFEHTKFVLSDNFEKMYEEYLKMPFGNIRNDKDTIYEKGWCVQTGMSIVSPHPHRHYTLNEFIFYCGRKQEMFDNFKEIIDNK